MYFQRRRSGYSFIYYDKDLKRNVRLKKSETPPVDSDKEAQEFCDKWNHESVSTKAEVINRLAWKDRYPDFVRQIELFQKFRREDAPYNWPKEVANLEQHVFPFFLLKHDLDQCESWPKYFEDFRSHLETSAPIKTKVTGRTLAYSTINNIIKALNAFMLMLYTRRLMPRVEKCRFFDKRLLNKKGEEAYIEPYLQDVIFEELKRINHDYAEFFYVALRTGLRLNEQLGLSLGDLFQGTDIMKEIRPMIEPLGLKAYGYIEVNSQPELPSIRNEDGDIPRKPLKNKPSISSEFARRIPLFDKQAFNILVYRWNVQRRLIDRAPYGYDFKNYLLFDGLTKNTYSSALRKSQFKLKRKKLFTPHDTRHTYSTWLIDKTDSMKLVQMILGHADEQTTRMYTHLSATRKKLKMTHELLENDMPLAI